MKNMVKHAAVLMIILIAFCNSNAIEKNSLSFNYQALNNSGTQAHTLMSIKFSFQNLKKYSISQRMGGYPPVTLDNQQIPVVGMRCTAWAKYSKENEFNNKNFIRNIKKNDDYFYFTVSDKLISVYSDDSILSEKYNDSILITTLHSIQQREQISGGVCDIGNFNEGYCFELKGVQNVGEYKWIVCNDTYVF